MRTKTLLLTAALSAAGIATSMAQVYSVNAVGYVNTTLKAGFNLISNPLDAADDSIKTLFAGVPNNTRVYKFNGTGYDFTTYSTVLGAWNPPAVADMTVTPGEGVFVRLPAGTPDHTVTFVGEVPQGAASNTQVPAGFSIRSSAVPQAGLVSTDLQFPAGNNDRIYKWNNATSQYTFATFSGVLNAWNPAEPTVGVGEAVFVRKTAAAPWTRNFSVNQ
jgi:hypothetical protein